MQRNKTKDWLEINKNILSGSDILIFFILCFHNSADFPPKSLLKMQTKTL